MTVVPNAQLIPMQSGTADMSRESGTADLLSVSGSDGLHLSLNAGPQHSLQHRLFQALLCLQSDAPMTKKSAALGELYDQTAAQLMSVAKRIVRQHQDAEDVLSEVFRQIWERPGQYASERGPVMAWLYMITKTRALDALRKLGNHSASPSQNQANVRDDLDSLSADTEPAAHSGDLLNALQEGSWVHRAMQNLSADQRRMLEMAFFQDLSHQEISDLSQTPLGTVKSHIRRGQAALKEWLDGEGFSREST